MHPVVIRFKLTKGAKKMSKKNIKTFETKLKNLGFKKGKPDKDGFTMFTFSPADLAKMVDKKNKKKRAQ